jgi:hypothetical protein
MSAAVSSNAMALTVVSVVPDRYSPGVMSHLRAAPLTCRTALSQDTPSRTKATASTMYEIRGSPCSSPSRIVVTPCQMENPAPSPKVASEAMKAQK